jgi:hypothetical protein
MITSLNGYGVDPQAYFADVKPIKLQLLNRFLHRLNRGPMNVSSARRMIGVTA